MLTVPHADVALLEVAAVKRGARSDWRDALEEPVTLWDGPNLAEALQLIERLPESELFRCFTPAFGLRAHDKRAARMEVLFCFKCHMALMIDLSDAGRRQTWTTFDGDSGPARELLYRFRTAVAA